MSPADSDAKSSCTSLLSVSAAALPLIANYMIGVACIGCCAATAVKDFVSVVRRAVATRCRKQMPEQGDPARSEC